MCAIAIMSRGGCGGRAVRGTSRSRSLQPLLQGIPCYVTFSSGNLRFAPWAVLDPILDRAARLCVRVCLRVWVCVKEAGQRCQRYELASL